MNILPVTAKFIVAFQNFANEPKNNYTPATNHASRVYSIAAVLCLQFVIHGMLFRP
jgi:hypothetical protein